MTHEQMLKLQVGDRVENCNYQIQEISQIDNRFYLKLPSWYDRLVEVMYRLVPFFIYNAILNFGNKHLAIKSIMDKTLTFKDGRSCSAIHCCSLVE